MIEALTFEEKNYEAFIFYFDLLSYASDPGIGTGTAGKKAAE